MKRNLLFLAILLLFALGGKAQTHWTCNPYQFPTNMTVTAVCEINGVEQTNETLEIGAFCEDECRGSVIMHKANSVNRYYFFLVLHGTTYNQFYFRLYDHFTEEELDLASPDTINYSGNDIIGSVSDPYVFTFTGGNCTVLALAEPEELGTVTGGGDYPCGTWCTLTAEPAPEASFVRWNYKGQPFTEEPSFSFNALSYVEFVAVFHSDTVVPPPPPPPPTEYLITVNASPANGGLVEGGGLYEEGSECVAVAIPNDDYRFICWTEQGDMVSPDDKYAFIVDSDRDLTAVFSHITAVGEDPAVTGPAKPIQVFDLQGRMVWESKGNDLDLSALSKGVYLIRRSDGSVRKWLVY